MTERTPKELALRRNRYLFQVWERRRELVLSPEFLGSCALGVVTAYALCRWTTIKLPISDLATLGINYSALSFGACITGAVLAIGLPSQERVAKWANTKNGTRSTYNDLIFNLTWAGFAQLLVLAAAIASYVIGNDVPVVPAHAKSTHRVLLAVALAIFFYGAIRLMHLLGTISMLGNVVDFQEQMLAAEDPTNGSPREPGQTSRATDEDLESSSS
jgi:hypothetical protein